MGNDLAIAHLHVYTAQSCGCRDDRACAKIITEMTFFFFSFQLNVEDEIQDFQSTSILWIEIWYFYDHNSWHEFGLSDFNWISHNPGDQMFITNRCQSKAYPMAWAMSRSQGGQSQWYRNCQHRHMWHQVRSTYVMLCVFVCGWQCTACEWVSQTTVDKTESQNIHPKHKIVPWNEVERWRFTSKAKGISVIRRIIWLRFFHIKLQMNDLIVQLINRKRLFSQFECCRCISFRIKSIQCHLLMSAVKNGQSFWVHTYEHMRHLQRRAPAYEHSDKTELNAHRKRWHRGSAIH